eukprot:734161-Prorocentrum_minimum.AAC.1
MVFGGRYAALMKALEEREQALLGRWEREFEERRHMLEDNVLVWEEIEGGDGGKDEDPPSRRLVVNFPPPLVALLREVKYLTEIPGVELSGVAAGAYQRRELYEKQRVLLGGAVSMYNAVVRTLDPIDRPLHTKQLRAAMALAERAASAALWISPALDQQVRNPEGHL